MLQQTFLHVLPFALVPGFLWWKKSASSMYLFVFSLNRYSQIASKVLYQFIFPSAYPFLKSYQYLKLSNFFFLLAIIWRNISLSFYFLFLWVQWNLGSFSYLLTSYFSICSHLILLVTKGQYQPCWIIFCRFYLFSYLKKKTQNVSHFQYVGTSPGFHESSKVTWGPANLGCSCKLLQCPQIWFPIPGQIQQD